MGKRKINCRRSGVFLQDKFLDLDRYSYPVTLNVNGHKSIGSFPGTIITLALLAVLICYAIIKFQMLIYFQNPQIGQALLKDKFEKDFKVNMTERGFKIAFGTNDYTHGTPFDDPDYVQWVVRLNQYENQRSVNKTIIKFHKCNQADYDQFYPPAEKSVEAIANIQNFGLYCIDEGQDLILYGSSNFHYQRFEIMLMPCTPNYQKNICINRTLQDTIDYLSSGSIPDLYIMENTQRFDFNEFKNVNTIKESVLNSIHLNLLQASTVEAVFNINHVQDSSSILNLWSEKNYNMFQVDYKPLRPSSSNRFPLNYKFIGAEYIFNVDQTVYTRQTYDILNWIGDVGGLDSALYIIGVLIISGYSEFNAYGFLMSLLFLQSNKVFQNIRSSIKPQQTNNFFNSSQTRRDLKEPITLKAEEKEVNSHSQKSIFEKFAQNALKLVIKQDFVNRTKISQLSLFQMLFFCCNRNQNFKRFIKMNKRGMRKADRELDIIRLIKQQRVNAIELWALLPQHLHLFSEKLGEPVLSEFSSNESSDNQADIKKVLQIDGQENYAKIDQLLEEVVPDQSPEGKRLINMFINYDMERNQKWQKQNPDITMRQNIQQLKFLIARNLIKKQKINHFEGPPILVQPRRNKSKDKGSGKFTLDFVQKLDEKNQGFVLMNNVEQESRIPISYIDSSRQKILVQPINTTKLEDINELL